MIEFSENLFPHLKDEVIIELENVTKKFKKTSLLKDINLSIYKGQSVALIGNNGVGKSTLLKIIANLSSIESGKVTYNDHLSFRYVPEQFPRSNLTTMQYLNLMGRIDEIDSNERYERIKSLLKDFFMEHMIDTPLAYLSKGSLQKVGVIQALLTTPDVLLLDEPLSGQDANSQRVFIKKIKALLARGTTIIMSCHEQYLINEISDTIIEIKKKQIEVAHYKKREISKEYILIFTEEKDGLELPKLDVPINKVGKEVKMYVNEINTNEVISLMINNGWSLRSMYHEENN